MVHEPENTRFTLKLDGIDDVAFLAYTVVQGEFPEMWNFRHTFCPPSMRGRGVAGQVVAAAFDYARSNNIKVLCLSDIAVGFVAPSNSSFFFSKTQANFENML